MGVGSSWALECFTSGGPRRSPYATQPTSSATSSTGRPIPPTSLIVNNARAGAIVGSCSTNDVCAQSVFVHVQRSFRHRRRSGRPNAGESTSTAFR